MENINKEIISPVYYNRNSKEFGEYKVIDFLEFRGKTKVPYYKVKFKKSGNIIECPLKTILSDKVVDVEEKKKQTKKKNREKNKLKKQEKKESKRFILNLSEEPKLLALDLSTHNTGYAVFIGGRLVDYGCIYQPKTIKWDVKRINFMKNEIIKLAKQHEINCFAIEDIIMKNKIALHVLSKLQGVCCDLFYKNHKPFLLITPKEWKSLLDINKYDIEYSKNSRIDSKEKTVKVINQIFSLSLQEEFPNQQDLKEPAYYDVADAIGVGYISINHRIK